MSLVRRERWLRAPLSEAVGKIAAMKTTPTTPPRPFDITAIFPQLAPLARTATRLFPRPGSPSPQDSSIGGPLLWPADEPWPHCEGPHVVDGINPALPPEDARASVRRIRAGFAHGAPALGGPRESHSVLRYARGRHCAGSRRESRHAEPDGSC